MKDNHYNYNPDILKHVLAKVKCKGHFLLYAENASLKTFRKAMKVIVELNNLARVLQDFIACDILLATATVSSWC